MNYGDVRRWQPAALDAAEQQLKVRGDILLGLEDELRAAGSPRNLGWSGQAADTADVRLTRLCDRMEHTVAEVSAARTALITAADSITVLQHKTTETDWQARAQRFRIDDSGNVTDLGMPPDTPPDQVEAVQRERVMVRAELMDWIKHITTRAEQIDNELAGVLAKIERGQIHDNSATTLAAAAAAGATQGSLHDSLLARYRVPPDPEGKVMWPDGATGWLAQRLGISPLEMSASEARHLEDRGLLGAADAYGIYKTALHDAQGVWDRKGETDGHSDAFRHAYWSAMLSHRFGEEWTESYTTAHERKPDDPRSHATGQAMDLHNNEVGRRIAVEHPDAGPEELKEYVKQAVEKGDMVVVNTDGRLVRSNEVDIGQTGLATDPQGTGGPEPQVDDKGHTAGGYNYGRDGDTYGTYDG